ncbi:MAG: galactose-1-phosphate uridylyltransferase [Cellulosilyticaceae bacterium]
MSYLYDSQVGNSSSLYVSNRQNRPMINKENTKECPFCVHNNNELEEIKMMIPVEDGDCIRIVNNKYPVTSTEIEGVHDVVIDTIDHYKKPYQYKTIHWVALFTALQKRWIEIAKMKNINMIQIFKNNGERAGASIEHQHWQIIALEKIPKVFLKYYETLANKKDCIFCNTTNVGEIILDDEWVMVAPYASQVSNETWIIPKNHKATLGELNKDEILGLAKKVQQVILCYEQLKNNLDYNICIMNGMPNKKDMFHLHIKIIPRKNYFAGFELATGCCINEVTPKEHADVMKKIIKNLK